MTDEIPIPGFPSKKAMLEELYEKEGLTIEQISRRFHASKASVVHWMVQNGIARRGRGGRSYPPKLAWRLHRIDPRLIFGLPLKAAARLASVSESYCHKYKEAMKETWTSQ